jgi:hypothetical protein
MADRSDVDRSLGCMTIRYNRQAGSQAHPPSYRESSGNSVTTDRPRDLSLFLTLGIEDEVGAPGFEPGTSCSQSWADGRQDTAECSIHAVFWASSAVSE